MTNPVKILYYDPSATESLQNIDFIGKQVLPDELICKVFSYLGEVSLCNCAITSKEWKRLAYDDLFWNRFSRNKYGFSFITDKFLQENAPSLDTTLSERKKFAVYRKWQLSIIPRGFQHNIRISRELVKEEKAQSILPRCMQTFNPFAFSQEIAHLSKVKFSFSSFDFFYESLSPLIDPFEKQMIAFFLSISPSSDTRLKEWKNITSLHDFLGEQKPALYKLTLERLKERYYQFFPDIHAEFTKQGWYKNTQIHFFSTLKEERNVLTPIEHDQRRKPFQEFAFTVGVGLSKMIDSSYYADMLLEIEYPKNTTHFSGEKDKLFNNFIKKSFDTLEQTLPSSTEPESQNQ